MQIFKFGGASVKDAESIKNVASILAKHTQTPKIVVISAMGKTTNALEDVVNHYVQGNDIYLEYLREIREYHITVAEQLFGKKHHIEFKLFALFDKIEHFCTSNNSDNYNYIYDQIICIGELASTRIISDYLNQHSYKNTWLDAREVIRTDNAYTDAKVDWKKTEELIRSKVRDKDTTFITQGFIGSTSERFTTTLGREGSDFTGAIFAHCTAAESMSIWKDVEGVLNADPKQFDDTVLLEKINYSEAIEMTYYGAKVIHPKTIQPLQNKNISLHVRSFNNTDNQGTKISHFKENITYPPIIVRKENQALLSFSAKDFSFIAEDSLTVLFKAFNDCRLKTNIIQSGAISFSVAVDNKEKKIQQIIALLKDQFTVRYNEDLTLFTIRHYTDAILDKYLQDKEILLTQKTRQTIQVLYKK